MDFEVRTTAEFDACLGDAVTWRMNNYSLRSARRLLDATDDAGRMLTGIPLVGSLVDDRDPAPAADALRWIRIDSHIAVYRINDKAQAVYLLKLFHASSNWRRRVLG